MNQGGYTPVQFDGRYGPGGKKAERRAFLIMFALFGLGGIAHHYFVYKPLLERSLEKRALEEEKMKMLEENRMDLDGMPPADASPKTT